MTETLVCEASSLERPGFQQGQICVAIGKLSFVFMGPNWAEDINKRYGYRNSIEINFQIFSPRGRPQLHNIDRNKICDQIG